VVDATMQPHAPTSLTYYLTALIVTQAGIWIVLLALRLFCLRLLIIRKDREACKIFKTAIARTAWCGAMTYERGEFSPYGLLLHWS
jgi:hypothetical protein